MTATTSVFPSCTICSSRTSVRQVGKKTPLQEFYSGGCDIATVENIEITVTPINVLGLSSSQVPPGLVCLLANVWFGLKVAS